MTYRAPKGTEDILPPASRLWRRMLRAWDDLSERYGYDLVLTPLFEDTAVFERGMGEDTEVVQKQMYTFEDRGGRSLTLRPEGTASVVRAYLQAGAQGILKGTYWGPMFRYERPQAGRSRQFYQSGVEYLGTEAPLADVEVIELGYRFLQAMEVPDVVVLLNSIGDPDDRASYRDELVRYLEVRRDQLSADSQARIERNPLRVLDSKEDAPHLADAPRTIDHLGPAARAHFDAVRAGLDRLGIPYRIDPRLVRGLDYYNRTVFEYIPEGYEAAQSAVGGGGRYDGLAELLGGPRVPAVGLAMGLDRIVLASAAHPPDDVLDLFLVVTDPERLEDAFILASRLRTAGMRVDLDPSGRSVKAQFRAADRRGALRAAVVGDEFDEGKVTLRDLRSGEQRIVRIEELETWR